MGISSTCIETTGFKAAHDLEVILSFIYVDAK